MMIELSDEQRRAVNSTSRALIVTASAGSGKTEVIAQRIERILDESPASAERVLALSYTVKAADELDERVRSRVGDGRRIQAETIHAFAHQLVRQHGTWEGLPTEPEVLHRDEDRVDLLLDWMAGQGTHLDSDHAVEKLQAIDLARARMERTQFLDEYRDALTERGALDYPAMLEVATRLVGRDWVRTQLLQLYGHVIIDEAQNLTPAQYEFVRALLGPRPTTVSAMLVGDPKQSIVQFAGADPGLIDRFRTEYDAEAVALSYNYRSSQAISRVAEAVARALGEDQALGVVSAAQGEVSFDTAATEDDEAHRTAAWINDLLQNGLPTSALAPGEANMVQPDEIAVLARTGAALRRTADALDRASIENVVGSDPRNWMSSSLGQAIVDLIAFRAGPNHPSSQAHLSESARCDIGSLQDSPIAGFSSLVAGSNDQDPDRLFGAIANAGGGDGAWNDDLDLLGSTWKSFLDRTPSAERSYATLQLHVARVQRGEPAAPGVRLLTVHKSQGREFRAVSIIGLNEGQFPDFRQTTAAEKRAELHCFYVAASRPTRLLRLSRAQQRTGRNGLWEAQPSEYLGIADRALRK